MTSDPPHLRVAIVGMGPRGLGAAEALVARAQADCLTLSLTAFDPTSPTGAGPNFDPGQTPLNMLNIPLRDLRIGPAAYSGADLPGFTEWIAPSKRRPDRFPARAEFGTYLVERYRNLVRRRDSQVPHIAANGQMICRLENRAGGWWLLSQSDAFGAFDEVLLTQGQPATAPDEQLKRWRTHAIDCGADLVSAYPDHELLRAAQDWTGRSVAVRGMGLSMFDVVRLLTLGMGGRFEHGRYHASGREAAQILPFSLDGRPPYPKPASQEIDSRFDPQDTETSRFVDALTRALAMEPDVALFETSSALVPPAHRILRAAGSGVDENALSDWFAAERDQPGTQETRGASEVLKSGIAMARGHRPPSIGFVVGQLWRKWQEQLRSVFNTSQKSAATAKAMIGFDEGLKRFSYGPPVAAAEELLILIEAGLVDLRAVDDPDVLLTPSGWQLVEDDVSAKVSAMVDAVLPNPSLPPITDPLMKDLIGKGMVCAAGEGLGALIRPDGTAIGDDGRAHHGLCLLGRMAIGSNIAVDSVHDCFGDAADRWAAGVSDRLRARRVET